MSAEPKGLAQLIEKESVLYFGEPGTSKTYSIWMMAKNNPDSLFFIIDPDNGSAKVVKELGGVKAFKNVEYRLTTDWTSVFNAYQEAKVVLKKGDWLCLDQMGRLWEMAQAYYSEYTYEEETVQHLLEQERIRVSARKKIAEMKEKGLSVEEKGESGIGGFGTREWTVIKRLHNDQVIDDAVIKQVFNVFAVSAGKEITPLDTSKGSGDFQKKFISLFLPVRMKPEGEKHNVYRFDTIASAKRVSAEDGVHYVATILRDRGRGENVLREIDVTGEGFWAAYGRTE